jgi:hypothetical protein
MFDRPINLEAKEMDYLEVVRRVIAEQQSQPEPAETLAQVIKGRAIALYCDPLNETIWIVADEQDAELLGEPRGTVYTAREAMCVVAVADVETVAEIHRWKKEFNATITEAHKLST